MRTDVKTLVTGWKFPVSLVELPEKVYARGTYLVMYSKSLRQPMIICCS